MERMARCIYMALVITDARGQINHRSVSSHAPIYLRQSGPCQRLKHTIPRGWRHRHPLSLRPLYATVRSRTPPPILTIRGSVLDSITVTEVPFNHPKLINGTIKHIPTSARTACADHLSGILRRIENSPDVVQNWADLLGFGNSILAVPPRAGKRNNLTKLIKNRITGSSVGPTGESSDGSRKHRKSKARTPEEHLSTAVSSKIEDGNLRAAVRMLCSDDRVAEVNEATFTKLLAKHPPTAAQALICLNPLCLVRRCK